MKKTVRSGASKKAKTPPYKNPSLPSAKRTKDLLSRMTLEEKAAQMLCIWMQKAQTMVDADGNFELEKAKAAFILALAAYNLIRLPKLLEASP